MRFFKLFSVLIFLAGLLVQGVITGSELMVHGLVERQPSLNWAEAVGTMAWAKDKTSKLSKLTKAFKDLQKPALVTMQVKKKVSSQFVMRPKESEGSLHFSKGKIRLKMDKPTSSLLVLNGDDIWNEEKLDEELGGGIQVSYYKSSKAERASTLIALLSGRSEIEKEFKLKSSKTDGDITVYQLEPKDTSMDVKQLNVTLDASKKYQLKAVSYADEVENLTEFEFSDIKAEKSAKSNLFKYTPPEGAEVTKF